MDPLAVRSPRLWTPRGEHIGWKGVCEHGDVGAHTRCHNTKPWEEVALALSSRVWSTNTVLSVWGMLEPGDTLVFRNSLGEV